MIACVCGWAGPKEALDKRRCPECGASFTEASLLHEIRLAFSQEDCRLFRNTVGVLQDMNGQYVRYGLAIGSSDLIGWRTLTIMPKDVGNELAVFCAIECKAPAGKVATAQKAFLDMVTRSGGLAGVARSIEDARRILHYVDRD